MKRRRKTMLIDSHAHLDDEAFNEDREELMGKFKEAGIEYIVNIAAGLSSIKSSIALAEKYIDKCKKFSAGKLTFD